jgi:aromatic ring-opening dioxygenase catalytic subunit (LigB family)
VPTPEHYLAPLYVRTQQAEREEVAAFNDRTLMASISMTCFRVGGGVA